MKVAIVGSRDFARLDWVREYVRRKVEHDDIIISGGARGVDQAAVEAAQECGVYTRVIPADWSQGKGAGKARNWDIIEQANKVVAFWDGDSPGTAHDIALAVAMGTPVEVYSTHPRLRRA